MSTLIVAFPKIEEAKAVRSLLVRRGYDVAVPCTSGAQAINQADNLSDGIIICGYKLSDNMLYSELYEYKPKSLKYCLSRRRICGRNVTTAMLYALPCRLKLMIYYLQLRLCSNRRFAAEEKLEPRQGREALRNKR